MKKNNVFVKSWEKSTENLSSYFVKRYFKSTPVDVYWIVDKIGGVLVVNDYFFDMNDMVDFLRYNFSVKQMFEYYNDNLSARAKGMSFPNIENYKKIKKV